MCEIDYRFRFLKIFDLYFAFEIVNSNESDYITSRSLSEILSKKYVGQCVFVVGVETQFKIRK